jgi:c-di-GMP-binding flagellar brake protein YcgR
MGIATPFPEPESPQLQRFAVRSPAEVVGLLRAMQDDGVPLNAFLEAGASFGVVTLLAVDEAAGQLEFAGPADEVLRGRLRTAPLVTCVGFVDAVKVQFTTSGVDAAAAHGSSSYRALIPAELIRLQRRSAIRVRPEPGRGAVCRIPLPGGTGEREALRVLDIGTGGIAVMAYPERFEPIVGTEIHDCRLDLPGVGGAVVSLRVRHVGPLSGDELARYCGCEFVHIAPAVQTMLLRHVEKRVGQATCGSLMMPLRSATLSRGG